MIKVFIGYDRTETVSFWVLAHSIMRRCSEPVSIIPLNLDYLPLKRPRAAYQSTEFSFSRFLVPWLCNYEGSKAIYMDCDMLCLTDMASLIDSENEKSISVVKHDYTPEEETKMLGVKQSSYPMKNWSSFMVFNPSHPDCRKLTPKHVDTISGLFLHQFTWTDQDAIGELDSSWNHLAGVYAEIESPNIVHWTKGGPWWEPYKDADYADLWRADYEDMISAGA